MMQITACFFPPFELPSDIVCSTMQVHSRMGAGGIAATELDDAARLASECAAGHGNLQVATPCRLWCPRSYPPLAYRDKCLPAAQNAMLHTAHSQHKVPSLPTCPGRLEAARRRPTAARRGDPPLRASAAGRRTCGCSGRRGCRGCSTGPGQGSTRGACGLQQGAAPGPHTR